MSREAVAKDLARISAQLGKGSGSEASLDSGTVAGTDHGGEPASTPIQAVPVEMDFRNSEEPLSDDTASASSSGNILWDDAMDSADSGDSDEPASDSGVDSDEAEAPTVYGRHRAYRGAAFRRNDNPSVEEPKESVDESKEPVPDDRPQGFSTDEVSFGRAKRKKTRR